MIFGDLKMPDIDWKFIYATRSNDVDNVFLKCMSELGMTQFVTNPTRISNSTENILDLIFSDDLYSIQVKS